MFKQKPLCGISELFFTTPILALQNLSGNNGTIYWEHINLQKHLPKLYQWVGLPYAHRYWQMDHLSFDEFYAHYENTLAIGHATSLIGYYEGEMICQVDVYKCFHDEIAAHYPANIWDLGIHFLMAPIKHQPKPGLSVALMQSALRLLFSIQEVNKIMGEPDATNTKANELVRKAGFHFLHSITMSYKTANLYECTRQSVLS